MMQKLTLFFVLILSVGLFGKQAWCLTDHEIVTKVTKLNEYYAVRDESSFFKEFPNSFADLNQLYGFDDGPCILSYQSEEHILEFFNKMTAIEDEVYYRKIIAIAIDGKWDADAISFFQWGLEKRVLENKALTVSLLSSMPDKDILGFWRFFFDGPHPDGPEHEATFQNLQDIKTMNDHVFNLMTQARGQIVKEWEHH